MTTATSRSAARSILLLGLLLLGLLVVPLRATSQEGASNVDMDSVADDPDPARRLFNLINAEREAEGLASLRWNGVLETVALDWSDTMSDEERLYHRPDLGDVITSDWRRIGENVGVGPEIDRLHQAFMDSPGHRNNVVGDYDQVGIAVQPNGSRIWVTVNFGKGEITSTYVTRPASTNEATAPSGTFSDVRTDGVHYDGIEALVEAGITTGCSRDDFCPGWRISRGQMASFVARAMDLSTSGSSDYRDVQDGSVHDGAIAAVTGRGVMDACATGFFCPTTNVDRAEMANILARMLDLDATARSTVFSDVSGALVGVVEAIREIGVTEGCGGTRYCPDGDVTRAEMATFLSRALGLI